MKSVQKQTERLLADDSAMLSRRKALNGETAALMAHYDKIKARRDDTSVDEDGWEESKGEINAFGLVDVYTLTVIALVMVNLPAHISRAVQCDYNLIISTDDLTVAV